MKPDVCVIGAGLSGLTDAILLAEAGRRVTVLEHHSIPGGYLQQFQRKGTRFDVGFHWVGCTRPGLPFHKLLTHLRILDRVEFDPYPAGAAVEIRSGDRSFAYPTRFDAFVERALATWPREREGILKFAEAVNEECASGKWFDLRKGVEYDASLFGKSDRTSARDRIREWIEDPWLREVIEIQAYNIGLSGAEIPWSKFALVFRANLDDTSRIRGGGDGLVQAMLDRGRELGVEYRFREGAAAIECRKRRVVAVETDKGNRLEPEMVLAACHPKTFFRMIDDDAVGVPYKDRIFSMRDSRGALQVFARLRRPLESIGRTGILLLDGEPLLVLHPDDDRLEAMIYSGQERFAAWRDQPVLRRDPEYGALKERLMEEMLDRIAKVAPEVRGAIEDLYGATPLSDEWYTRNEHGSVFGVSHDLGQQGLDRPAPRMRLKNVWFTGHSITMPGILGVMINAFATCDGLRGDGWLFDSVAG